MRAGYATAGPGEGGGALGSKLSLKYPIPCTLNLHVADVVLEQLPKLRFFVLTERRVRVKLRVFTSLCSIDQRLHSGSCHLALVFLRSAQHLRSVGMCFSPWMELGFLSHAIAHDAKYGQTLSFYVCFRLFRIYLLVRAVEDDCTTAGSNTSMVRAIIIILS